MMLIKNKMILFVGTALLLPLIAPSSYASEASRVATANSNIVVQTTAQASLTLEPRTTILAGKYSEDILLANWNAEVTAGSLAFRFNPTIMKATNNPAYGTATSKESSSNTIPLIISTITSRPCSYSSANVTSGWYVCNQGLLSSGGYLKLNSGISGTIAPGTYPLSMDVAVWAY